MENKKLMFVIRLVCLLVILWAVVVLFVGFASADCRRVSCGIPYQLRGPRMIDWRPEVVPDSDDWRLTGELVCPMPEFPDYCYRDGGKGE